jgi:pyridoxine 4-dehydrogenase
MANNEKKEPKNQKTSSSQEILHLQVPLAVGTLQWGTTPIDDYLINGKGCITESDAALIVREFTNAGVTLWDTAEGYGGGTSEQRLGRLSDAKNTTVIMTKLLPVPWRGFWPNDMERAVRASCHRLGIPKIPIYLLHSPVHWRSLDYWIARGADCKRKGLLDSMGLSNCNADQVRRAVAAGKKYGVDIVVNQVHYSLLDYNSASLQEMERTCRELQVAIVGFSALGQGLLTDTLTPQSYQTNRMAKMLRLRNYDELQPLRTALKRISQEYTVDNNNKTQKSNNNTAQHDSHHKSMAQVAINWSICHGVVPLVGCRSPKQAKDSIGALGWRLKPEHVQELDRLALKRSTFDSPGWKRMIFVSLFGLVMIVCQICDTLGYGIVKHARL